MVMRKSGSDELKCSACNGFGFPPVKKPSTLALDYSLHAVRRVMAKADSGPQRLRRGS